MKIGKCVICNLAIYHYQRYVIVGGEYEHVWCVKLGGRKSEATRRTKNYWDYLHSEPVKNSETLSKLSRTVENSKD